MSSFDMTGVPVELMQMLDAREARAAHQRELLELYQHPLVSFTMNIAGPVKDTPLIRRGFDAGREFLEEQFRSCHIPVLYRDVRQDVTGNEAFYVLDADPLVIKRITAEIEDKSSLGRLFDMDVIREDGSKVDREELFLPGRKCLLCENAAKLCSSRRVHTAEELQDRTARILKEAVLALDTSLIAQMAEKALLYEAGTTPKPGLVDRYNSGSHKDMDIFTFMSSAVSLHPYFEKCARIGMETETLPAPETFARLRAPGREAEGKMFAATGGVNTHKGAIFTIGILCAALGRAGRERWDDPGAILAEVSAMTEGLVEMDLAAPQRFVENTADPGSREAEETAGHEKDPVLAESAALLQAVGEHSPRSVTETVGQRLYRLYGITGVRGQVEAGLPAVRDYGLPVFERGLEEGFSLNRSGCAALLTIMAHSTDTNLIARGGLETQKKTASDVAALLEKDPYPDEETLKALDRRFIEANLSPGGSADLLAAVYLLHFMREGKIRDV